MRDIYAKLPAEHEEDHEYDVCGKLAESMYGTPDAAQSWQRKRAETVQELGLSRGQVSLYHFYHQQRDVCKLVHGGDFDCGGHYRHLRATSMHMAAKFKVKVAPTGRNDRNELRVLNRAAASSGRKEVFFTMAATVTLTNPSTRQD